MSTVHEGMAAVTRAVSYIAKERSEGVSYEFRGIDAVMNHLHGPLAENELFLSPRVLDDWQVNQIPGTNNRTQTQAIFRVCVDVYAADGSMVTLGPGLAQSHDYGDKAAYQAQQNAIKYLLLEAFAIPTAELDMDARHPDEIPAATEPPDFTEEIRQIVSEFGEWDDDKKRAEWIRATAAIGYGKPKTLEDVNTIAKRVREFYAEYLDKLTEDAT